MASHTQSARPHPAARLIFRLWRSCRLGARAAGRGVIEFYSSDNLTFASSIAYYALLSFFPFVLLLLTLLGRLAIGMNNETLVQVLACPVYRDQTKYKTKRKRRRRQPKRTEGR